MKEMLWIILCVFLFSVVMGTWIQRVVVIKEGIGSSNVTTQPDAANSKNHSKNISSVDKYLEDLEAILIPIFNQVNEQNQIIKIVVDKEPKTTFTSPDITLDSNEGTLNPTMHIKLPYGRKGETGLQGKQGDPGAPGKQGPRGPRGV